MRVKFAGVVPSSAATLLLGRPRSSRLAMSSSSALALGAVLASRYYILSVIGRGSFTTIFRAVDLQTLEHYAVKVENMSMQNSVLENERGILQALNERLGSSGVADASGRMIGRIANVAPTMCDHWKEGPSEDGSKGKAIGSSALRVSLFFHLN